MRKRYYFTITKGTGKNAVELFMYLHKGKFKWSHALHSCDLLSWFKAHWYWLLFNLPSWARKNGSLFAYQNTTGVVKLRRLNDEMLS